jgi:hypothetical protein
MLTPGKRVFLETMDLIACTVELSGRDHGRSLTFFFSGNRGDVLLLLMLISAITAALAAGDGEETLGLFQGT